MEFNNRVPIYIQVINKFKSDIITGKIKLGEKMPSTRDLAKELGINPNTATRIYREMEALGLCFKKRGLGTFITEEEGIVMKIKGERGNQLIEEFYINMKKLGYSLDEMIELIHDKEDETNNKIDDSTDN